MRQLITRLALAAIMVLATMAISPAAAHAAEYIVVLDDSASPAMHAKKFKVTPYFIYKYALKGYAADLTAAQAAALANDASVQVVEPEYGMSFDPVGEIERDAISLGRSTTQPAQAPSTAVQRVGTLQSPTARIDGKDQRVRVDVAVIDTGVSPNHPDLNVVGGYGCSRFESGWKDTAGHGTMVAGFIGALDNKIGKVGVAPGASIWSVKVLDSTGFGTNAEVLCGIDWATSQAGKIKIVNMSLGGPILSVGDCSKPRDELVAIQGAVCASQAAGLTYVVAAGNESQDASNIEPAAYPEVITVSAMADRDGQPGALGGVFTCDPTEFDDTFANFSNHGAVIDISAPGTCISSTHLNGGYGVGSGTSFAAPIVTGAAALYLATHPYASQSAVAGAIVAARENVAFADDPDAVDEGVVNVATF